MPALPANPYITDQEVRDNFQLYIRSMCRLAAFTMSDEATATAQYITLILSRTPAFTNDLMSGMYAAVWELAGFIQSAYGADSPISVETGESACGHDTCTVNHHAEAALVEAAVRGDGGAIKGICKATVSESRRRVEEVGGPHDPCSDLAFLFVTGLARFFEYVGDHGVPDVDHN